MNNLVLRDDKSGFFAPVDASLIGSLLQGNALSAAADNAAEFVSLAIQGTPYTQDTRFGVWFEPLLPRLCPLQEEPEGIL